MSDLDKYIEDQTADSGVIINISKTPETEKTGAVVLKVESVEGIEGNIDLNNIDISALSEEEKKNMIKTIYVYMTRRNTCFDEMLKYANITEEEFWSRAENIDSILYNLIESLKQNGMQTINNYTVVNPDGDILDVKLVSANGTYTFKVVEIITGETYTKTVQVSNIDNSMKDYYVEGNYSDIVLLDKITNKQTTFESAYIIYNSERIDITRFIVENDGYSVIKNKDVGDYLYEIGKISNSVYEYPILEIVKNGKKYFGISKMFEPS